MKNAVQFVRKTDFKIVAANTRIGKYVDRAANEDAARVRELSQRKADKLRVPYATKLVIELARRARLASDPEALEVRIALVGDVKVRPLNEATVPDARKPRFHGRGKKRVRVLRTFKY